jgi:hypothetical protein
VKKSKKVATVRTTVNTGALLVISSVVSHVFGVSVDLSDPTVVAALTIVTPIFYRTCRWASAKWPSLGYVLFGNVATPEYGD